MVFNIVNTLFTREENCANDARERCIASLLNLLIRLAAAVPALQVVYGSFKIAINRQRVYVQLVYEGERDIKLTVFS